jgi:hypothetical protein
MTHPSSNQERILTPELNSRADQASEIYNLRCTSKETATLCMLTTLAVVGMAVEGPTSDTNLLAKKTIL